MVYQAQLLRAIKEPYIMGYQLTRAEKVEGTAKRVLLLTFLSLLIFGTSAYLGIGSSTLSRQLTQLTGAEYETTKLFFALGQLTFGLVATALYIFIPATIFWAFSDTYYFKFMHIQFVITAIYLFEKAITLPIQFALGLNDSSSPFSLGILAQTIVPEQRFLILVLAKITLFQLWAIYLQYTYVAKLIESRKSIILTIVMVTNVLMWLTSALYTYIDFEKLL